MTISSPKFWAVVPAAGIGKRFDRDIPKQFHQLCGQSIAQHTLQRLLSMPFIEALVIPSDPSCKYWSYVPEVNDSRVHLVPGGDQRAHSVFNGLLMLREFATQHDWVLVHDMVRPCVMPYSIEQLVKSLLGHPVGGILATPINDTLKKITRDDHVSETVDRSEFRAAQTPQMFRFGVLMEAIQALLDEGKGLTDESSAIEHSGLEVLVVEGRQDNIKITRSEDLAIAEAIMRSQALEPCV